MQCLCFYHIQLTSENASKGALTKYRISLPNCSYHTQLTSKMFEKGHSVSCEFRKLIMIELYTANFNKMLQNYCLEIFKFKKKACAYSGFQNMLWKGCSLSFKMLNNRTFIQNVFLCIYNDLVRSYITIIGFHYVIVLKITS